MNGDARPRFVFCRVCYPMVWPESEQPYHRGHHSRRFTHTGMGADVYDGWEPLTDVEEAVAKADRPGLMVLRFVYQDPARMAGLVMCPDCRSGSLRTIEYLPNGRITGVLPLVRLFPPIRSAQRA